MSNFSFMWDKLPDILRKDNTRNLYLLFEKLFDNFDKAIEISKYIHIIDLSSGENLDNLGKMLKISKNGLTDDQYRSKIKIFYYTYYFVPNLNNFLFLIKEITGYFPTNVVEGWQKDVSVESGLLELDIVIPAGADDSILIDFDKIYGAGCRLDWSKLQEAYSLANSTGRLSTGMSIPYDVVSKIRIGEFLGTQISRSTGEYTKSNSPYDTFIGGNNE